jgi:hypothetical protein
VTQQPDPTTEEPVCTKTITEADAADELAAGEGPITPEMLAALTQLGYVVAERE